MQAKCIDGIMLKNMIMNAVNNLEKNKKIVDELNVFPVPDGDTGTNMLLTIQYAANELTQTKTENLSEVAQIASSGALMGARGNSGVILSQLFRGFAKGCRDKKILSIEDLCYALKESSDMAYKAVMKPTEGTILTVARKMAEFAIQNISKYEYMEDLMIDVICHGKKVLADTPNMLSVLKEAGVVDAGGKGLIIIFEGAYEVLTGKKLPQETQDQPITERLFADDIHTPEDITFGYCTEFIILTEKNGDIDKLKEKLSSIGDSIIVVGDEEKIKVHVHTDDPDKALRWALEQGALTRIKIDNMREQMSKNNKGFHPTKEVKQYGFIAVASGEGMKSLLNNLGVDQIITGGQTMNPSTQDFMNCIQEVNAENIFILPNNSNIILAANQAKSITDKNIIVIPTKTIPQGITAVLSFNSEESVEENEKNMKNTITAVKTGQVTYAIRDTQFNGKQIKKDDVIGIIDGNIDCVGSDKFQVTESLLSNMVDDESELISIYYGVDVEKDHISDFYKKIEEKYDDLDVEIHNGGQPLYYFIISVE
ncbi:MAG: DAK2 domain-containing protein [Eubacteriales bacterium]